ncbi:MAG TPA: PQQ-dependent sugar dehydrogenase [Terriglobales bacterium]|nr:PQQ-dependent sugar dehydrogenase [Terriglobales bacterium]
MNIRAKIIVMRISIVFVGAILLIAGALVRRTRAGIEDAKSKMLHAVVDEGKVLKGEGAYGDWKEDAPGVRRLITPADMPKPYATKSAENHANVVSRPDDAWPKALPGFKVDQILTGLNGPRLIRTAPNGDLFISESEKGQIRVIRGIGVDGKAQTVKVYATGLKKPFGIAFYPLGPNPQFVYVANTGSVVRFPYQNGDLTARGAAQTVVAAIPGGGHLEGGGHWTRDIAFSKDGQKMFVSVGSHSNVDDGKDENRRADILEFNPDGSTETIYAWGIRNAVGIAVNPTTGDLWASVNERDGLGDDLVPDYITHVQETAFYGWPWYYIGANQDPRHAGKNPALRDKVVVPDVLLQSHSASLEMVFYDGKMFPSQYDGWAFAAEHGSWNRAKRTGYKIIAVPMQNGKATGEYQDFVTGFVTPSGEVWGRPVGVTVASDGALIFTDDGSDSVWRVSYTGSK